MAVALAAALLAVPPHEAFAQSAPTISTTTLTEAGVSGSPGTPITIENIPADWTLPVTHSLAGGTATVPSSPCSILDSGPPFGAAVDSYDVCDDQSASYDESSRRYRFSVRASIDSEMELTETFTVTISDESSPAKSLSFEMTIIGTVPVVSVGLPAVEGVSRTAGGELPFEESLGSVGVSFDVSSSPAPPVDMPVCVRVTETAAGSASRVASTADGIQTVTVPSTGSGTHTVMWTNTSADDPDSVIAVEVVAPETDGCAVTDGLYTVSGTNGSDKARVLDDEATVVEVTSSDPAMAEGDASDTAVLSVSLDRRLYGGEAVAVSLALSTTTGARLPGDATPDFAVSASGTGVTVSGQATASLLLVFTGDDNSTVQAATVTLTPTAGLDDPDTAAEQIDLALTALGGTGTGTTVSGGAMTHATKNAVQVSMSDDEADDPVSVSKLRVSENGGTATYEVKLNRAPSGGNTVVTIARAAGSGVNPDASAATLDTTSLTFTSSDFADAQTVTVTGVDELSVNDGTYRDRTLMLTHMASGGGYSRESLGDIAVTVQEAPQIEAYSGRIAIAETPGPVRNGLPLRETHGFALQTDTFPVNFLLRSSHTPVGEPITVTVSVASTYMERNRSSGVLELKSGSIVGLRLTPRHRPTQTAVVQSLTLTFEDREPGAEGCSGWDPSVGSVGEYNDATADTSFHCVRQIDVVRRAAAAVHGCQDINVTASGGGVRTGGEYGPEKIRVHVWDLTTGQLGSTGTACSWDSVVPGWKSPRRAPRTEYCTLGGRFAEPAAKSCYHFVDNLPARSSQADASWAPEGAQLVHEGSSARYEIDLGVEVQRGQGYELELKPSGATMGDDYTLTLDTDNSPHVTVDPDQPLDSAVPRLVFAPGAQVASIVVTAIDDDVHEREVLTIGYGEYRYKNAGHPDKVTYPKAKARFAIIDSIPLVPAEPVANLRVTADDATTATAAWDPVAGATAYNVSYQGNGGDPLNDVSGAVHGHTDTSWTFAHNAAEPDMVITVTVTPVRTAGDGVTTTYHALSAAADLDLAAAPPCRPDLPADAVTVAEVTGWRDAHSHDTAHVKRWNRVLAALGEDTGETPLTVAESEANETRFMRSRWDRVTRTLEALAQCDDASTATTDPPDPPPPVCTPQLPAAAVTVAEVTGWRDAHSHDTAHVKRWNRVLAALGAGSGETPMTAAESEVNETRFMASRWDRVTRTLAAVEQCDDTDGGTGSDDD